MKIISIVTLLIILVSCQKATVQSIKVITGNMHSITSTSIIISGKVDPYQPYQSANTYEWGICYSTSPNSSVNDLSIQDYYNVNDFETKLTNLTSNTQYYAKAYFSNSVQTYYGLEYSFKTPSVEIGQYKEGGIVFWIDPADPSHGLVCSIVDQGVNQYWGTSAFNVLGAEGINIGTGYQNSIDMQSDPALWTTPSDLCLNLNLNGYNDWFLPSLDEIKVLMDYKYLVNNSLFNISGNALEQAYWTSSEVDESQSWSVNFTDNIVNKVQKEQALKTRAVRRF